VKIGIGIVVGMLVAMGGCVACGIYFVGNAGRQVQEAQQEKERSIAAAIQLLQFEDVNGKTQYSYTTVSGRVRNNSKMTFEWVKVGVDWSDEHGQLIDSGYTYLVAGEALQPGAAKAFQIMNREDKRALKYRMKILEAR
jgi:hypothetical protein